MPPSPPALRAPPDRTTRAYVPPARPGALQAEGGGAERGRGEGIRAILGRALDQHRLTARISRRLPLAVWAAAVGEQLAARVQPTVLDASGTLHLLVEDHRWRDQIDAARGMVLARLNARLGGPVVRQLRFGLAHAGLLPEPPALPRPPSCAAGAEALLGTAPLNPELRAALLGAALAARRRAAAG